MRRSWNIYRWLAWGAFGLFTGCASWEQERLQPTASSIQTAPVTWTSSNDSDTTNSIRTVGALEAAGAGAKDPPAEAKRTFTLPSGLPGAEAAPIHLPSLKDLPRQEREKKVREAYPALPPLTVVAPPQLPESGHPWSLPELQANALEKSPVISRASADADAAYGHMIQAGLYPNPHIGYQGDQIQPGKGPKNNAGQQGAFIQQLIKTCGKLTLARAVAGMNYANAQVALRRAQLDVLSQVRSGYFAVVVARETMNVSRTLAELADEVYRLQLWHVISGDAAGYEPLQLYAQAAQARNIYIQASNRYVAAWKQLAANMGEADRPLQVVGGTVDAPLPPYDAESARQRVLERHTDVLTALNTILEAQYQLRLAQVTPIPDIALGTAVQHDNSVGNNQVNITMGFAIPVFDRNQGNIRAAWAMMARAQQDLRAKRNDLSGRLAEALARFHSGQAIVPNYRERILPNLSRAYRTIYQRYQQEPDKVAFNDIVVAQQNLGQALNAYLTALGDQWTAVVDVANLLQIDDLYEPIGEEK